MTTQSTLNFENFETQPLSQFTEKAYLDYSMYVILDRALPHIGDGLKPVQRRIVYAMSELGLKNTAKYKKSARTVGDVLGKFHPHGDAACYEAMVLMAQPFAYRYPLVDGQGNWGSADDPKSFAAMRYTESRLTKYANLLLEELGQGTVDWIPNFDGSLEEPKNLPAKLPNILLNGGSGIAVGMATDIPPHNLNEVVNACVHLIDNPKATNSELMGYLLGPDYPTEAEIITPAAEIQALYSKGQGSIKLRAVYTIEQDEIVITALPHQVSGNKILEQIAAQMHSKKLPLISDLRDESDHENPTRLVIVPKTKRVNTDELMGHLFATTDLERNYRVNFNMIGLNGKPQVKDLHTILSEWLVFRKETTRRRLQYRLDKILNRLHLLDGFMIAFLNIDKVIKIIREEENPKAELIKKFKISEIQADAILDLKLRHLAKLEEMKIRDEQAELNQEKEVLEKVLGSNKRLATLIKKECQEMAKLFGDARRSPIVQRTESKAMDKMTQVPADPITIVLSEKGWIRAGKGHEIDGSTLSYKSGDSFLMQAQGKANQPAVLLDSTGKSYALQAHTLPSVRGHGEPVTGRLSPPNGAFFSTVLMGSEKQSFLMFSNLGYGFITSLANMVTKNRNGKQLIKLAESVELLPPVMLEKTITHLAFTSAKGILTVIEIEECPQMEKGKGARLVHIDTKQFQAGKDRVLSCLAIEANESFTLKSGSKKQSMSPKTWQNYIVSQGEKGTSLPKGFTKNPILIRQ